LMYFPATERMANVLMAGYRKSDICHALCRLRSCLTVTGVNMMGTRTLPVARFAGH
jgi:hypothetical protein